MPHIKSKNIEGPWSEPVYLTSSGFDASILHDDDGKKYIVSLEWETREGGTSNLLMRSTSSPEAVHDSTSILDATIA